MHTFVCFVKYKTSSKKLLLTHVTRVRIFSHTYTLSYFVKYELTANSLTHRSYERGFPYKSRLSRIVKLEHRVNDFFFFFCPHRTNTSFLLSELSHVPIIFFLSFIVLDLHGVNTVYPQ